MKRLPAWAAVLGMSLVGWSAAAQTPEDFQKQLAELRARVQSNEAELKTIKAENADLKSRLEGNGVGVSALETQINRLQDCCDARRASVLRSAANPVSMGGEFRFRRESSLGDNVIPPQTAPGSFEDEHDGHWTDARVRINFRYDFAPDATAFAELQSHWAFGDDPTGPIDDMDGSDTEGDVHMYQAWLEVRNMFGRKCLWSRVGRQEIVLGNQFQFGNADWYNGVVFDGGRVDWDAKCWSLTLLTLKLSSIDGDFNQISSFTTQHDDDE